jgi:Secretion system C-terminal sorting domain
MKKIYFLLGFLCFFGKINAQIIECNHLGAWLWYIETTDFLTHESLADSLKAIGVKRVYVKVADGQPNPAVWPELTNLAVPEAYKSRGLECFAWSYNYTNNPTGASAALYTAAATGYDGYVVDVETEFDGKTTQLSDLFTAFAAKKTQAIADGKAAANFKLYCTTWGNPADHDFHIELIDPHVDGFMPQTYVEQWGQSYTDSLEKWIAVGNAEYISLGATKPNHHIMAMQDGELDAAEANRFIAASGAETSIWRIFGGNYGVETWTRWNDIDWDKDFCAPSSTSQVVDNQLITLLPNPAVDFFEIKNDGEMGIFQLFDSTGKRMLESEVFAENQWTKIDISSLSNGIFQVVFFGKNGLKTGRLVVLR